MVRYLFTALLSTWAFVSVFAQAPGGKPGKRFVDRTLPARMELLYEVVSVEGKEEVPVGEVLHSSLVVLDEAHRTEMFSRFLFSFEDGFRAAVYVQGDLTENEKPFQDLFIDPRRGEWILLREKVLTEGEGFAGLKRASEQDRLRSFLALETRQLRLSLESEESFEKGNQPQVFVTAEPELVAFIQDFRRHLGETGKGPWGVLRTWPDQLAELLVLPAVTPAPYELRVVKRAFETDQPPQQSAPPLAPELESRFGKWATWRELPRLKSN